MNSQADLILGSLQSLRELKEKIFSSEAAKNYTSPFAGSSKSLFVRSISEKEKQILLLFASAQLVNETKVELSILGLEDKVIIADDFSAETLQEKLTDINNRESFVLISTYDLLKLKQFDEL